MVSAPIPTKALLLAIQDDPAPAIAILQQLNPDMVCFFLHDSHKQVVETRIHPALPRMPQRWDWIFTPSPESFPACHRALAQSLHPLLTTWNVVPGELMIDVTGAPAGMASAMVLAGFPFSTKVFYTSHLPSAESTADVFAKQSSQSEVSENG